MRKSNENQRTEIWKAQRRGIPTASKFSVLMAKRGLGATALTYAKSLVADLIQDEFEEDFISKAMQDGIDREPLAISKYERDYFVTVEDEGFIVSQLQVTEETETGVKHSMIRFGCSPDGLIGDKGGIEVKCPGADKHTSNLLEDVCPAEYYDQIQGCMFVTNRDWWDFVSYNPNFKSEHQMKVIRVKADKDWQEKFKERLISFDATLQEFKDKLKL